MSFAYLSASDRQRLQQLPFPVALPQQLPAGWSAQPVQVLEGPEEEDTSVEVVFLGPESARWSVLTANGGMGDVIPGETDHNQQLIQHPVFGQLVMHRFVEDGRPELASDWFPEDEDGGIYHLVRGLNVPEAAQAALLSSLDLLD